MGFISWKYKILFFIIALKISHILDSNLPPLLPPTPEDNGQMKEEEREEDKLLCRGHNLHNLSAR